MTAVVVDGKDGKEYRLPTRRKIVSLPNAESSCENSVRRDPVRLAHRELRQSLLAEEARGCFRVRRYGMFDWAISCSQPDNCLLLDFVKDTSRSRRDACDADIRSDWIEAISCLSWLAFDRLADYSSTICQLDTVGEKMQQYVQSIRLSDGLGLRRGDADSENSRGATLGPIEWIASLS